MRVLTRYVEITLVTVPGDCSITVKEDRLSGVKNAIKMNKGTSNELSGSRGDTRDDRETGIKKHIPRREIIERCFPWETRPCGIHRVVAVHYADPVFTSHLMTVSAFILPENSTGRYVHLSSLSLSLSLSISCFPLMNYAVCSQQIRFSPNYSQR